MIFEKALLSNYYCQSVVHTHPELTPTVSNPHHLPRVGYIARVMECCSYDYVNVVCDLVVAEWSQRFFCWPWRSKHPAYGEDHMAGSCGQPLACGCLPPATGSCILLTTCCMNADFYLVEPSDENLGKNLSRGHIWAVIPWLLTCRNCEIIDVCCFKVLSFW